MRSYIFFSQYSGLPIDLYSLRSVQNKRHCAHYLYELFASSRLLSAVWHPTQKTIVSSGARLLS